MLIKTSHPQISANKALQAISSITNVKPHKKCAYISTPKSINSQLTFMGLINKAAIQPIKNIGEVTFQKFIDKLDKIKAFSGITILKGKGLTINCVLMDKPRKFADALDFLTTKSKEILKSEDYMEYQYSSDYFDSYKEAIQKNLIPNFSIKGIIGQGYTSTAFLTEDNKVIKLAPIRNFPESNNYIENVDIPIEKEYIARLNDNEKIYGTLTPLSELGSMRFRNRQGIFDYAGFDKAWEELNDKLKGTKYSLNKEIDRNEPSSARQIGFIGDKVYLLDYDCINGRF